MEKRYHSAGDSIIGRKLLGFSRKIVYTKKGKMIFPSNKEQYLIKKRGKYHGGLEGICRIEKEKKDISKIPRFNKLRVYWRKGCCLEGGEIYCECEEGKEYKKGLRKLGHKHGMSYTFISSRKNENALAIIIREISLTGEIKLGGIIELEDIEVR
jgi:hypothetical protein